MGSWVSSYWRGAFLLLLLMVLSCMIVPDTLRAEQGDSLPMSNPWYAGMPLYEINVRSFSPEGTLKGVEARLASLAQFGIRTIWLMSIFPVGVNGRKGTLGSPYSIRDYFEIGEEYGTKADFKALVDSAHALGMHVMLDMVMNHGSNDQVQMKDHPDWFMHDSTGAFTREVADWSDITDWDYSNPEARVYLADVLLYWAREFNLDGYRFDVAGMVPRDFWEEVIPRLKALNPKFFLLAEWEEPWMLTAGFDAEYDWMFFHAMEAHSKGDITLDSLWATIVARQAGDPKNTWRLRFVENHDEKRSASVFGWPGVKPYANLIFTLPGIPLLYNGQEVGAAKKLNMMERDTLDWNGPNSAAASGFYKRLLRLRNDSNILQDGDLARVKSTDPNVLLFTRSIGAMQSLIAINFSSEKRTVSIGSTLAGGGWVESLDDGMRMGEIGSRLELPPLGSRIFFYRPVSDMPGR